MTDLLTKQVTSYALQFQVLKTTGWAESTWTDKRLAWDPAEHGGIDRLNVHHHHVSYKCKEILDFFCPLLELLLSI